MSTVISRFHLQDNGFTASLSNLVTASTLASNISAGSGQLAQLSLDITEALVINASNMDAALQWASLLPKNTVVASDTGTISLASSQNGISIYNSTSLYNAIVALNFPGATLVQDI